MAKDGKIMTYNGRRVLVTIAADEGALSIVDKHAELYKRLFARLPSRCIELDRVVTLHLTATEIVLDVGGDAAGETIALMYGSEEEGAAFLAELRLACRHAAVHDDTVPRMSPTRTGSFTRRAVRPIGVGECAENGSDVAAAADLGCSQLSDLIFIGGRAIASDRGGLASRGINRVVNMATECENFFEADGEIQYLPDDEAFGPAVDDIVAFVDGAAAAGGNVLVHCNSGISRSTAAVLACLVKRGACRNGALESCGMSLLGALAYVKERRPIASPHPAYMTQLCAYEVRCHGGSSSLNEKTYRNNRYEDVAKLGSDKEDPRGSATLLEVASMDSMDYSLYGPEEPATRFGL